MCLLRRASPCAASSSSTARDWRKLAWAPGSTVRPYESRKGEITPVTGVWQIPAKQTLTLCYQPCSDQPWVLSISSNRVPPCGLPVRAPVVCGRGASTAESRRGDRLRDGIAFDSVACSSGLLCFPTIRCSRHVGSRRRGREACRDRRACVSCMACPSCARRRDE